LAKSCSWQAAMQKLKVVFDKTLEPEPPTVSVVIPVYNKRIDELNRAIQSAAGQTVRPVSISVVDDGSENGEEIADVCRLSGAIYHKRENAGVANARNFGISVSPSSKYIVCLDADDWLDERFIETCLPHLESDNSLGIAYTGLQWHKPDGSTGLSQWPGAWEYDKQLQRKNQVPTACVFKREMWERLGGYRQRYAPTGAGAEDAEFWLRAGAYGYGAKKVADEGLFHYSWLSGATAQAGYKEVDWTQFHPWTKDGQHPLASFATPAKHSHPVRQYDEPTVSVIIPVGPNHRHCLIDALDSLEAQTFRKWEAIAVMDGGGEYDSLRLAYPYVRFVDTDKPKSMGAGYARNLGVRYSRAPFLLFLDADDGLQPDFLEKTLTVWNKTEAIVYTDYLGIANVDDPEKLSAEGKRNLLDYNARKKQAVIMHRAADYDCDFALRQPASTPFVWCNVTALTPKIWHEEIGGFDERMKSWEDVDYWYRMAWAGKCFTRLPEPLMVYRFYTGERREFGLVNAAELVEYIKDKKKGLKIMGCSGCGKSKIKPEVKTPVNLSASQVTMENNMSDSDFLMVEYTHTNRGQHPVYGGATKTHYGYRGQGDKFLVHKNDVKARPDLFRAVESATNALAPQKAIEPPPPPPQLWSVAPEPQDERSPVQQRAIDAARFSVETLPGITPTVAARMIDAGLNTPEAIIAAGVDGLISVKGIAETRAKAVLAYLDSQYGLI